jgi:hypothetical protein
VLQFKTGDIILFHAYDNLNPLIIGSFWGHIGIVYKDNDDPNSDTLLFEAASTTNIKECANYNKHGIMISKLKNRIEKYPGLTALKSLNKPVNDGIIRGFMEFIKYAKQNMYYNDKVIHNALTKKMGGSFNIATNCGELVILSLIKLALLPQNILKKNIGHHLLYVAKLKQLQNNHYLNPIEITFDPFL